MSPKSQVSPQRAPTNRERVSAAAWDLFWSRGFHATSVADIAKQARLPKGSIYNYFPSKEELLISVMGRLKYDIETVLRLQVLSGSMPPSILTRRLIDHYADIYGKQGYQRGDPLSACLSELAGTHPELTTRLLPIQQSWLQVVTQKIWAYATVASIPALIERAPNLAQQIYASLQGTLLMMHAQRSPEPLEEARRTLVPMISVYVAALATGEVPEAE
jgi:TetR/AcrR family transcriptional regulator, transcriptional repressor for nem operon